MQDTVKATCAVCGRTNRLPAARLSARPKCGACGAALADGTVAVLDLTTHDKATRSDEVPLVVDYWAPWCGPCRMMAPEFARVAKAMAPRVRFAKIDTQDYPRVSQDLGIRGIPLLILWHKGKEVARLAGAHPAGEIEAFVRGTLATKT